MGRSALLAMVVACCAWVGPALAQDGTRCLFFSGTSNSIRKAKAAEEALTALRDAIDKWKTDNAVTGLVTETPQRPEPRPYWRSTISPELMLPPDIISETAYTICWKGVVSPVVCTSGAKVCW